LVFLSRGVFETSISTLKFIGALAVTTAIFFALQPEEKIDNEVLNASMEFLGKKLLAMAPSEKKDHVQKELEKFREQTLSGKVSDEHFEGVTVAILNAEAEGRQLESEEIDSLLTAEEIKQVREETKRERRDRQREWHDLGKRLEAYRSLKHA
jgi:hypothetical protein